MFEFRKPTILLSILSCCCMVIPQPSNAAPNGLLGDVNGDYRIDSVDASQILRYYADTSTNSDASFDSIPSSSDVDGNNVIDAVDASNVLKYYVDIASAEEDSDRKFSWPIYNIHNLLHGPFYERLRPGVRKEIYAESNKDSTILSVLTSDSEDDFAFISLNFTNKWKKIIYHDHYVGYIYIEDAESYNSLIREPIGVAF